MSKRNVWLVITSIVIGPLIGSGAFMLGTIYLDSFSANGTAGAIRFVSDYWPLIIAGAYALGFMPAIIFAVAMALLSARIPAVVARLLAAAAVGALISAAGIGLFLLGGFAGPRDSLYILAAVAVTGALSGLVSMAIIEWLHPPVKPALATA